MISTKQREDVYRRSSRCCEAVLIIDEDADVRARCGTGGAVEVHHMLTRGRGGNALDRVGETYHLLVLCPLHHRMADGGTVSRESGLIIDGQAWWDDLLDRPVYVGPDAYLAQKYPKEG